MSEANIDGASGKANAEASMSPSYPDWFPPVIFAWLEAHRTHPDISSRRPMIDQIAVNPIMKPLWAELTKQHPNSYVHAAEQVALSEICATTPSDVDERQQIAIIFLFKNLVRLQEESAGRRVFTNTEDNADRADVARRIKWLLEEAADTELIPEGAAGISWRAVAEGMRAKASVLDQRLSASFLPRVVVQNERQNPRGVATGFAISALVKWLFGTPLYQQAANIAAEFTQEPVTAEQVRRLMAGSQPSVFFFEKSRRKTHREHHAENADK